MNPEQKAYAQKISDLRDYTRGIQGILDELIKNCKHLIVEIKDFGGAYCDICGESFGWYCKQSPIKYCTYKINHINCDFCGQPKSRK